MSARTSARLRPVSLSARHVIVAAATATLLFACAPHRPGASNSTPDTPPLPPPPGQLAGRVDTSTDKAAITAPEPAVSPMAGPLAQAPMPSAVEMAAPRIADGVQGGIVSGYPPPMALRAFAPAPESLVPYGGYNRDGYAHQDENPFHRVVADPLSTFSIDVDTASYANVRRFLKDGVLPPPSAVRIEEMINYFRFAYPQPASGQPFSVTTELAVCPWDSTHLLALVGLNGRALPPGEVPARNLVFQIGRASCRERV